MSWKEIYTRWHFSESAQAPQLSLTPSDGQRCQRRAGCPRPPLAHRYRRQHYFLGWVSQLHWNVITIVWNEGPFSFVVFFFLRKHKSRKLYPVIFGNSGLMGQNWKNNEHTSPSPIHMVIIFSVETVSEHVWSLITPKHIGCGAWNHCIKMQHLNKLFWAHFCFTMKSWPTLITFSLKWSHPKTPSLRMKKNAFLLKS